MKTVIHDVTGREPLNVYQEHARGLRALVFCPPDLRELTAIKHAFFRAGLEVRSVSHLDCNTTRMALFAWWHDAPGRILCMEPSASEVPVGADAVLIAHACQSPRVFLRLLTVAQCPIYDLGGNLQRHNH